MVDNDLLGAILAGWVSGFGLAILLAFLSLYFIRRYSIPMLTSEVSAVVKFVVAANIFVFCNCFNEKLPEQINAHEKKCWENSTGRLAKN